MFIELEPVFNNIGERLDFDYEQDLSDLQIGVGYPFVSPVRVKGAVFNRAGVVCLEAEVDYVYSAPCDRCAQPTEKKTKLAVSHVLVKSLNDEDNDEFILIDDMRFELDELIREDILLSLPSRFLCSESCKGVCPYCGANLNIDSCGCSAPTDPRLAVLAQLLDNDQ